MALRLVWELGFEPYPFSTTGEFWSGIAAISITVPLGLAIDGVAALRRWRASHLAGTAALPH